MGPEATMHCYLEALQRGDIEAAFSFVSRSEHKGPRALQRYAARLESPLFRPLVSHISSKVCCSPPALLSVHVCSPACVKGAAGTVSQQRAPTP
jgi:hypothetical protein